MSALDIKKNPNLKEVKERSTERPEKMTDKKKRRFSKLRRAIKNTQNSKK